MKVHSPKRHLPLSFVGKSFRLMMNLICLTLIAWISLLFFILISSVYTGLACTTQNLQEVVMTMTTYPWSNISNTPSISSMLGRTATIALPDWFEAWLHTEILAKLLLKASLFISLLLLMTQLLYLRVKIFLLGSYLLLSMMLLGLFDGLIQRDIRTYRAARESSLFFHRAKAFLMLFFYSSYFLFIVTPVYFDSQVTLLTISMLLAYLLNLTSRHFKKYV